MCILVEVFVFICIVCIGMYIYIFCVYCALVREYMRSVVQMWCFVGLFEMCGMLCGTGSELSVYMFAYVRLVTLWKVVWDVGDGL